MIRGPQGPRMPCSSQPNREFARAPTRIFVWRQSLRVGVRADGTDPYGKSEPLYALVADLTADESLLLRETVDERRCRDEVGLGTLAEAATAYRMDRNARGAALTSSGGTAPSLSASRGGAAAAAAGDSPPSRESSSSAAAIRPPHRSPSSGSCATTSPSSARPNCAASPT